VPPNSMLRRNSRRIMETSPWQKLRESSLA
jgi:hypothetical protein